LTAGCAAGANDAVDLRGTWKAEQIESAGKAHPDPKGLLLVVHDDTLEIKEGKRPAMAARFKLQTATNPKSIDLESTEGTIPGIYQLGGDTLKLCWRMGGERGDRPAEFVTKAGEDGVTLMVFKRESREGTVTAKVPAASPPKERAQVNLEHYKGKGLLIVATPSADHPSYKQFLNDWRKVDRLAHEIELKVIEIVGGKDASEYRGPVLDQKSTDALVKQYVPDPSKMTVVVIDGKKGVLKSESGDINVVKVLNGPFGN